MNKHIDESVVLEMLEEGFTNEIIAERLVCSKRQVSRIRVKLEAQFNKKFKRDSLIKEPEIEISRRNFYKKMGLSLEAIGKKFGVSRQAIHKGLNNNGEIRNAKC